MVRHITRCPTKTVGKSDYLHVFSHGISKNCFGLLNQLKGRSYLKRKTITFQKRHSVCYTKTTRLRISTHLARHRIIEFLSPHNGGQHNWIKYLLKSHLTCCIYKLTWTGAVRRPLFGTDRKHLCVLLRPQRMRSIMNFC